MSPSKKRMVMLMYHLVIRSVYHHHQIPISLYRCQLYIILVSFDASPFSFHSGLHLVETQRSDTIRLHACDLLADHVPIASRPR
jgi:hypothetical protein